jgi:lysophospholipid acyltransferase (LPLAT)-like uncharacterized protein
MTVLRRLAYFLGTPILRGIIRLVTRTYRVEAVIGADNIEPFIDGKSVCAPAYWHQHHILCSTLVRRWVDRGFKACFLVSGSVDGEVPERIARSWGAEVIRGSANQSGALALRDMQGMMKRGYSQDRRSARATDCLRRGTCLVHGSLGQFHDPETI